MIKIDRKKVILDFLRDIGVDADSYCLTSGMSLEGIGVRRANDLDLCISSHALKKVKKLQKHFGYNSTSHILYFTCKSHGVDLKTDIKIDNYIPYTGLSDDEIIDNPKYHYFVDGLKIIRPELNFIRRKVQSEGNTVSAQKAKDDMCLLTHYIINTPEKWDWTLVPDHMLFQRFQQHPKRLKMFGTVHETLGKTQRKTFFFLYVPIYTRIKTNNLHKRKIFGITIQKKQINASTPEIVNIEPLPPETNINFPLIIWPPAFDMANEIIKDIKSEPGFEYIKDKTLIFKTKDKFTKFVRAVYMSDDIARWKIERKIAFMTLGGGSFKVHIIWIDNKSVKFRKKQVTGNLISITGEALKRKLRTKYAWRVDNYIYDIILHIGDNYDHNKAIDQEIEKVQNPKSNKRKVHKVVK